MRILFLILFILSGFALLSTMATGGIMPAILFATGTILAWIGMCTMDIIVTIRKEMKKWH